MATLVLGAVGGAIGGPIGAALGALAGNAIDHAVLRPAPREGPRLTDLRVQTSSYGAPIPKVWGTMRVAGCVIWATDLIEHRDREGGGKGRPDTVSYSYTASFAVALSARRVAGVGRIWADGKLIRGAAGDWKVETGFRLHSGDEDQPVDPLITAHEGAAAPAHRGIAYAVFEDLALADFGNRIPSLTFELIADAGPVGVAAVIAEASGEAALADAPLLMLGGFSAQGDARETVAMLAEAAGAWFAPGPDAIAVRSLSGPARTIADAGAGEGGRRVRAVRPIEAVPRVLSVAHYDPARDYQTGVQEARRPGAGRAERRVDLPAGLDAGTARTVAEAMLARAEATRVRRTVTVDIGAAGIAPGEVVGIAGEAGSWRVASAELAEAVVTLELAPLTPAPVPRAADPGRALGAPDLAIGRTVIAAFELPPLDGTAASAPRVVVAAAGTGAGWRRAALLTSLDGARWRAGGMTALPAVIGTVVEPPGAGPETLVDLANSVEVDLLHPDMALAGADDAALDGGANLAMIGGELMQFGAAMQTGPVRWRLSRLLRARRGMAAAHARGERFVLVEAAALATVAGSGVQIGGVMRVLASGVGDGDVAASGVSEISGVSVAPPAPVHLRVEAATDGGGMLRWTRRSRLGWTWSDGLDAPLGEDREAYRVMVGARSVVTDLPELPVTAAERAAHAAVTVRQIGTLATSAAATMTL
jgi:Putative phage tail protein